MSTRQGIEQSASSSPKRTAGRDTSTEQFTSSLFNLPIASSQCFLDCKLPPTDAVDADNQTPLQPCQSQRVATPLLTIHKLSKIAQQRPPRRVSAVREPTGLTGWQGDLVTS